MARLIIVPLLAGSAFSVRGQDPLPSGINRLNYYFKDFAGAASGSHQERSLPPGTIREIRVIVVPAVDARAPRITPAPFTRPTLRAPCVPVAPFRRSLAPSSFFNDSDPLKRRGG